MSEKKTDFNIMEDEYLDCLIRLAYDLDDLEKEQEIMEEAENGTAVPDEVSVRRAWNMAREKMDRYEQEEKTRKRRAAVRRTVPQVLKIAACLLVAVSIGVPVVIASSAEFRSRVIQLLVNIDRENNVATFDFAENPDASFAVPAEWTGDYFISWIPEGMEEVRLGTYTPLVEYRDGKDRGFSFSEKYEATSTVVDLEKQGVREVSLNGVPASLFEGTTDDGKVHTVTVMWSNDERLFEVCCNDMEADEALKIAGSVRKIIR